MTHFSVDAEKPENIKKEKSLTPTGQKHAPGIIYSLRQGGLQSAMYAPGVPQAPEFKSRSNKSNPMAQLISSQEVQSIGHIFFPQTAILCGIIPSISE